MSYKEEILNYIEQSNSANAGEYVLKSLQQFLAVMNDDRYEVRWDTFERLIKFFGLFKHYTGKSNGNPFMLENWQKFIVLNVFCVYFKDTERRKYQTSYIQVARKNGKSALASIMALYALLADGEASAQVVLSANSKEQANIIFKMCDRFISQACKKHIKKYRTSKIFYRDINELFIISADASVQDGLNPSFAICDEMHAATNDSIWQVLKSGMGMRENPHLFTITTAGFNKQSACYNLRKYSLDVLNKFQDDDSMFSMIFELAEEDDYRDENSWLKANPNLDVTVNSSWLATQVKQAENDPSMTTPILTKNLNKWMDSELTWIPEKYLEKLFVKKEEFEHLLKSEELIIYSGTDLSSVCDLTAVSYMITYGGIMYVLVEYFLPEDFRAQAEHKQKYRDWGRQGFINFTPGNVVDYDYILSNIKHYAYFGKSMLYKCFCDPYNASQFITNASAEGIPVEFYSQTLGAFNRPTKEMERLILSETMRFVFNPITLFCFRNSTLKFDYNNNCKPIKGGGNDAKIDGVIAALMGLAAYLMSPTIPDGI